MEPFEVDALQEVCVVHRVGEAHYLVPYPKSVYKYTAWSSFDTH